MYTIGVVGRFKRSTDEFFVVSRAYNHKDNMQQWHFDHRTKSLRLVGNKNFVLSFKGGKIAFPTWATVRSWRNEALQKFFFQDGKLMTKLRAAEWCLTFTNEIPNGPMAWMACRKTPHQVFHVYTIVPWDVEFQKNRPRITHSWSIKGVQYHKEKRPWPKGYFPQYGPKFMLELIEKPHRRMYMSKQKDGKDIVVKIKTGQVDWRAWFAYDKRTRSIRLHAHKHLALSNQDGANRLNIGRVVAFRNYKNQVDQRIVMRESKERGQYRIENAAKRCLSPTNMVNKDSVVLTWWKCNKNPLQEWKQVLKVPENKVKGKIHINPFHLTLKMTGSRRVYMSRQKQGKDQVLKIEKGRKDWRSIFIFDKRTKSIRLHSDRSLAMSNQNAKEEKLRLAKGKTVVMRKFKNTVDQRLTIEDKNIKNKAKLCLTPRNYVNKDNNLLTFWKCNKNPSQQWKWDFYRLAKFDPSKPVQEVKAYNVKAVDTVKAKVGQELPPPPVSVPKIK